MTDFRQLVGDLRAALNAVERRLDDIDWHTKGTAARVGTCPHCGQYTMPDAQVTDNLQKQYCAHCQDTFTVPA